MLTKTAYLAYVQCPKAFWLDAHQPELAAPPDPAAQRRLRAGNEVDRLARAQFPDGVGIAYRPHTTDMVPLTQQALAEGATTLFQATFAPDDVLVKVDVLTQTAVGWHLIEVKSTTSVKDEHLPDLAFQLYAVEQAGLPVAQASIMHLNKACCYPDLGHLFTITDCTEAARALLPKVAEDVAVMRRQTAVSTPPPAAIGRHCTQPYDCAFHDHCWHGIDGLTIHDIPRLNVSKTAQLQTAGALYLADIAPTFPLTATQRHFVNFIVQQEVAIDRAAIQAELARLEYPLFFFDFETIDEPVPRFAGCRPYQQVPFQYSCHVLEENGRLTHHDFLHTSHDDPRPALVEALLRHIGDHGHIVAYYAPFERGVLRDLAAAFPHHAHQLLGMADRLWDQLDMFQKHYRHHRFGKSNSLKSVLPVVTDLRYDDLDVRNGTQAQVAWQQAITTTDPHEKARLTQNLRQYCHLDTLAMVEIHAHLRRL